MRNLHVFSLDHYESQCTPGIFWCENCKSYEVAATSGMATKVKRNSWHFQCTANHTDFMVPTDKLYNNDSTKKGTSLCMISPITTVVDNDKEDSWSVSSKESSIEEEEQGELKRPAQPWNQPLFIISSSKQSIFKTCYRRSYVRQKQSDSVF